MARSSPSRWRRLAGAVTLGIVLAVPVAAQSPAAIPQERSDLTTWLASAPLSPYAAIAVQPIGPGISIGPESADIPLPGIGRGQITEQAGGAQFIRGSERIVLPLGRPVTVGPYRFVADGGTGRRLVIVYGAVRQAKAPAWFPMRPDARVNVELAAPIRRGTFRTLGLDGIETEAVEAGFVTVTLGGRATPLRVYRMGTAEDEEAELLIFFRDGTNAKGSYPAGRFVPLEPAGRGKYAVDFNRARNPFCAYSTVFPCPAPWPGNTLPVAMEAGEQYLTAPQPTKN